MKQPHIQLDESLNVRYAILPGDPRRAERIASHMSEVEDLGMNREYRSLVGAYRGARILAMSTGMGGVSTGIAVEELHNIGVTHAIRIGSCGALQTDIAPGELLIAAGAVRDDGTSKAYVPAIFPAVADFTLYACCKEAAKCVGAVVHEGICHSHESFYHEENEAESEFIIEWRQLYSSLRRYAVGHRFKETGKRYQVDDNLRCKQGYDRVHSKETRKEQFRSRSLDMARRSSDNPRIGGHYD